MSGNSRLINKLFQIRFSPFFEGFVVVIIVISAISVGLKTYEIAPRYEATLKVLDLSVTYIFLFELWLRFFAEDSAGRRSFFRKGWNIFDTIIVIGSLAPLEGSELILIGRLLRVFRVLRLVSVIPELRILIGSFLKAMPQLAYIVLLMFIIFYIYGAVGSTVFGEINDFLWGDISRSMLTLFRVMTFESWSDVMYETMEVYPLSWTFYLSFIFFTAFAFLNMVIGVVVNIVDKETKISDLQSSHTISPLSSHDIKQLTDQIEQLRIEVASLRERAMTNE
jgi:voltage-gated sodium channel|tara:strand:+ start:199 stop:1038 length:840 start_codon:yes stop_codon:yes gene_type:complete